MYEDYYLRQSGGGLPVFQGSRGQRGHGLGSMLSGFFRSAMPMIKRGLSTFGKHALQTGLEIAGDVSEGKSFKDSARDRIVPSILPGIKRFAEDEILRSQSGSGKRRRIKKRAKKSRKSKDIFN
jgi:hypothetical protein